ncbi:hypothetical protein OQA88_5561 [Cercophora sp. LCS_1]
MSPIGTKNAGGKLIPYSKAAETKQLDANTYSANLAASYQVGLVPNGGYVASCLVRAASLHLGPKGQPHPLASHFEFISRTEVGLAIIVVEVVKPGRALSTVHVTLYQGSLLPSAPWFTPGKSRKQLTAYLTMSNLHLEKGLTLPTGFALHNPPPPKPDFTALLQSNDAQWTKLKVRPPLNAIAALQNLQMFVPRSPTTEKSQVDFWTRFTSGEKFTNDSLAFILDSLPYTIEAYRPLTGDEPNAAFPIDTMMWYPTVVMNMDLKQALPDDGVDWLRLRIQTKLIRNGRLDLEVLVYNEQEELIALGHHVNLIVSAERNSAGRL